MQMVTPYIYGENIESLMKLLEQSVNLLFNWFKNNQMKVNENDCQVYSRTDETVQVNTGVTHISNSKCGKLLGIKIDCKISFDNQLEKRLMQN